MRGGTGCMSGDDLAGGMDDGNSGGLGISALVPIVEALPGTSKGAGDGAFLALPPVTPARAIVPESAGPEVLGSMTWPRASLSAPFAPAGALAVSSSVMAERASAAATETLRRKRTPLSVGPNSECADGGAGKRKVCCDPACTDAGARVLRLASVACDGGGPSPCESVSAAETDTLRRKLTPVMSPRSAMSLAFAGALLPSRLSAASNLGATAPLTPRPIKSRSSRMTPLAASPAPPRPIGASAPENPQFSHSPSQVLPFVWATFSFGSSTFGAESPDPEGLKSASCFRRRLAEAFGVRELFRG
eukprot:scaffold293764_cov30-Tisochrysis_lutea.AAC.2